MAGRYLNPRTNYISSILTERRVQKGLSQQMLSEMCGMALRVYQRLEHGEMEFADTRMRYGLAICRMLGLDPYVIVFGDEPSQNDALETAYPKTERPANGALGKEEK